MNVPQEDHRAPDFPELVKPLLKKMLKKIFKTKKGQCFIFPATGTAGWEIALANTHVARRQNINLSLWPIQSLVV